MKNCLIVIDMQNDFITGSLGSEEAKKIVPLVKERIEKAIKDGEDVYFTKDTHYENNSATQKKYLDTKEGHFLPVKHCIEGTSGHDICDELKSYEKNAKNVFIKNTFGFKDFPKYLSDYDSITLIGLCTDICVVSNAILIKAFYPEKGIKVEKLLCAGSTIENHNSALNTMKACHIEII